MAEIKSEVEDASELRFGPGESHRADRAQGLHGHALRMHNSDALPSVQVLCMPLLTDVWNAVFDKAVARPLSNSEALQVLNQTQQMRKDDDASYVSTPMVQQTKQYLERFNTVKSISGIENMQQ